MRPNQQQKQQISPLRSEKKNEHMFQQQRYIQNNQKKQNNQKEKTIVRVVLAFNKSKIIFEICIDQLASFQQFFLELTNKFKDVKLQLDKDSEKEFRLGNGKQIFLNDERSLKQLGFSETCTLYITNQILEKPIQLNVNIFMPESWGYKLKNEFKISIYPHTAICFIIARIKDELFSNIEQQHWEKLQFYLEKQNLIQSNENKWALEFDIHDNSVLLIAVPVTIKLSTCEEPYHEKNIKILLSQEFNCFVEEVKTQYKEWYKDISDNINFTDKIYLLLDRETVIDRNEKKQLSQLGFKSNSLLQVKWFCNLERFD